MSISADQLDELVGLSRSKGQSRFETGLDPRGKMWIRATSKHSMPGIDETYMSLSARECLKANPPQSSCRWIPLTKGHSPPEQEDTSVQPPPPPPPPPTTLQGVQEAVSIQGHRQRAWCPPLPPPAQQFGMKPAGRRQPEPEPRTPLELLEKLENAVCSTCNAKSKVRGLFSQMRTEMENLQQSERRLEEERNRLQTRVLELEGRHGKASDEGPSAVETAPPPSTEASLSSLSPPKSQDWQWSEDPSSWIPHVAVSDWHDESHNPDSLVIRTGDYFIHALQWPEDPTWTFAERPSHQIGWCVTSCLRGWTQ